MWNPARGKGGDRDRQRFRHDHRKGSRQDRTERTQLYQLIALAPGVSNQTGQDEAKVGVVGSVKYSVNGGRVEYNTFEVDGSDVLNTGLNGASSTLMVYPSLDAIQEVKVLTSNYGAQYGRTASGTVQVTTKSGTTKLHGNLYEFIRNETFNARNYFDPPRPDAPLYRRQDFGGTIGGPLTIPHVYNSKQDKTFFFFSEEVSPRENSHGLQPGSAVLKERGLIMTPQGIQKNLGPPNAGTGWSHRSSTSATFVRCWARPILSVLVARNIRIALLWAAIPSICSRSTTCWASSSKGPPRTSVSTRTLWRSCRRT